MNRYLINPLVMFTLVLLNSPVFSQTIYKCQSADGSVSYSQSQCGAGEQQLGSRNISDLNGRSKRNKNRQRSGSDSVDSNTTSNADQLSGTEARIERARRRSEWKRSRRNRSNDVLVADNTDNTSSVPSQDTNPEPETNPDTTQDNDQVTDNTPSSDTPPDEPETDTPDTADTTEPEIPDVVEETPDVIADTNDDSAPETGGGSPNETPTNTTTSVGTLYGPIEFEIISWPLTKAYPGIEYNIKIGAIGGQYPYLYTLEQNPDGMVIDSSTGIVSWTPDISLENTNVDVVLSVTDNTGSSINQSFSINVTKAGFFFISPTGNDSSGNGSIGSPWRSLNSSINKAGSDGIIYARGGNYTESVSISGSSSNKWIAFPGETPVLDLNFSTIRMTGDYGYVDGFEITNASTYAFFSEGADRWTFRRNHMHHLYDRSSGENPSFIFFADSDNPQDINHEMMIITGNTFHDLFDRGSGLHGDNSGNYHGGASVLYDVYKSLIENNIVYNIDGAGIKDKDNGQFNTYRGNFIRDNSRAGLSIANQYYARNIDVLYNVIVGTLELGYESGEISNVVIRHNTINGTIVSERYARAVGEENTIIIVDNIISVNNANPYAAGDNNNTWFSDVLYRDNNLIDYSTSNIQGYGWGTQHTLAQWQAIGFDVNSIFADPQFNDIGSLDYRPKSSSPACGKALDGSDIGALPCL